MDKEFCARGSNEAPSAGTDLLDNPFPRPEKVDLKKVFAYQFMSRSIEQYHATRRQEERDQLEAQVEQLAIDEQFVTTFTAFLISDAQVRKRRGIEKRQEIARLRREYEHQISSRNLPRVRRDASESPMKSSTLFIMVFAALLLTALPLRRLKRSIH